MRRLLSILAAALGAAASLALLAVHGGGLAGVCGADACAAAAHGPWSTFPPDLERLPRALPRVPVAALGLALHLGLGLAAAVLGRPPRWLAALAAAGALVYTLLGLAVLAAPCPLCLTSHAAALALWLLARRPGPARPRAAAFATAALALGALLAALAWAALRPSTDALVAEWRASEVVVAGSADGPRLVVYSDLACPACRDFHRFARERLAELDPTLAPRLRHRPLTTLHAHALDAARSVEAAREQGRGDEAVALLLADRAWLAAPPSALAEALGLDPARFLAARDSAAVADRLARDRAAGDALGLDTVPAVFLDGRPVPARARVWLPFWRAVR